MKWNLVVLVLLLICAIVQQDADDWPMFQHDPWHSGYSSSPMPESLKRMWVNERSESNYDLIFSLVISAERLFVSTYSSLYALDINTGSITKTYNVSTLTSFPAVEANSLCLNSVSSVLCLETESGEVLWNYHEPFLTATSFPIVVDGYAFFGGGDPPHYPASGSSEAIENWKRVAEIAKRIMCVDLQTGEAVWEFYAEDYTLYSPAYVNGRIYISEGIGIYCLDAQTGEEIWRETEEWLTCSSLSSDAQRIFLGTYEGILCHDMETGNMLWKFKCDDYVCRTPATAYGKVFASSGKILYCLDAESGKLKWKREVESPITTELVVADGKVAFGTADGMLYIVKAGSGKVCESLDLGDSPVIALALSNGKLIVAEENWRITCFEGRSRPLTEYLLVFIVVVAGAALLIASLKWYQKEGIPDT